LRQPALAGEVHQHDERRIIDQGPENLLQDGQRRDEHALHVKR
jgi:hypothetical protein